MMHGRGKMVYADGSRYVGYFEFNKREGTGKMVWSD
jgi:hypothetical protein